MVEAVNASTVLVTPDTWSVKEVVADLKADIVSHLDKQDGILKEISLKVDSKADKADLVRLTAKIDAVDLRVGVLETVQTGRTAVTDHSKRIWATVSVFATITAMLVGGFIYNLTSTVHHP